MPEIPSAPPPPPRRPPDRPVVAARPDQVTPVKPADKTTTPGTEAKRAEGRDRAPAGSDPYARPPASEAKKVDVTRAAPSTAKPETDHFDPKGPVKPDASRVANPVSAEKLIPGIGKNLQNKGFPEGMNPQPDTRTEAQKEAAKLLAANEKAGIKVVKLDTGEKPTPPQQRTPPEQNDQPKEPVGPIERPEPTHEELMDLWKKIEPDLKRPDDFFFKFEKAYPFTRQQVIDAFKPVLEREKQIKAEEAKRPTIDVDHQARDEARLKEAHEIYSKAVEGGVLSSATAARQMNAVDMNDPKARAKVSQGVDNMRNTAALADGIRAPSTSAMPGPSDSRQLRRTDRQTQAPSKPGEGATGKGPEKAATRTDPLSGVPLDSNPKPAGAPGPAVDRGGPPPSGPRTPEQAAGEYMARHGGRLVDRNGALADIFRRTKEAGSPADGDARFKGHVDRTAASRELHDIHKLLQDPNVQRVEVVPSGPGGRTNDLDVYLRDGTRYRQETTTATSAPKDGAAVGPTRGQANPLVGARDKRIPETPAERQAALRKAIDRKLPDSKGTTPTQLEATRADGFPVGGRLSIHVPFAGVTRADCDKVIADRTAKLRPIEREVVIWHQERGGPSQPVRNLGELYARQADGTYRHEGTLMTGLRIL